MTIKTWKERLPKTKAATAHDRRFAMESEIDDLRAKSAMDDAMLAGNGALINELRAKLAEHKAARIAYASEPTLAADGEPDDGNTHANIRKLKKEQSNDRPTKPEGMQLWLLEWAGMLCEREQREES